MHLAQTKSRWPGKTPLALAIAAMLPLWSLAQTSTLEPVVISASRAEQRSLDVPAAITSVERDAIEQGPQVNLSESLNRVPGLSILNRQNYAQDLQISIRGFGARSAFGIRGIRLLIDGIPATMPDGQGQGSSISLSSTERIEVLRGPLAQLYGNSSGGVIQAFTREAPAQPEVDAQLYAGSFGLKRSDLQYAGRVGSLGNVGLVADYGSFSTDGYRANSRTERHQFNGKLSIEPTPDTKVNVVFNRFDMPLAQDALGLTATQLASNAQQAGSNAVSRETRKSVLQNQLGSTLTQTLDADASITARAYYGKRENTQYQTGLATSTGGWVGLDSSYYGLGLQYNRNSQIADHLVQWVAGYEWDHQGSTRQGGVAALGQQTSTTRNEFDQAGNSDFYLQATTQLNPSWAMVAGLRLSSVQLSSADHYLSDGNGSGSETFRANTPVLGLSYRASDVLNFFANVGRGFESPTLNEVAYAGTGVPAFNTTIRASSSQQFEFGAKWVPTAGARVDFTVFEVDSKNEIVVASSSGGNSTYKNAPGTSRSGAELSAVAQLTPHVRVSLAANWIDATYSQAFSSGTSNVALGNRIPGVPQSFLFSELLWSQLSANASGKKPRPQGAQAGLELTQTGRLYANDANTASASGYTTVNAKVGYGWTLGAGQLSLFSRVDNLNNQHYVGSVIVNQASSQFYEPAPGRNWTVGLRGVLPL
jgi:iron complex outermembrane receptor protein